MHFSAPGVSTVLLSLALAGTVHARPVSLDSPDHTVAVTIRDNGAALTYDVRFNNQDVILPSSLGITVDGQNLGQGATLGKPVRRSFKETYPVQGVHATAVNSYREAVIPVKAGEANWQLEVRAYDDGVAYRYRVPGIGSRKINGESSHWNLPPGLSLWHQLDTRAYEGGFTKKPLDQFTAGAKVAAPITIKLPGYQGYAVLTEANLVNYSDMALEAASPTSLHAIFDKNAEGWQNQGEILSPWRVTLLAKDLNGLVNSDLLRNLCPPPAPELANAAWIKPGRSNWHWMVTGAPKLEAQKQWVDWTKQLGFEYYLIDDGWRRWSADGKGQWELIKDVVDYAKTQNVAIFAWVDSKEIRDDAARAAYFQKAKDAGIVGLKIDFPHPADTDWVQWYEDTLRDTAKYELMVDFHGSVKPTGRERTWPHELTRESIRGRESFKQPSIHDTALPFTRYIQGHADFTPVEFRPNRLGRSTWAHELAQAVVYTSPFLCYSGSPESYLANPALDILQAIPPVWDETIVLPGSEIGQLAAFARRRGDTWFIGAINGREAKTLSLNFSFLGHGTYKLETLSDSLEKPDAWQRQQGTATRASWYPFPMRENGGFVARLTKVKD